VNSFRCRGVAGGLRVSPSTMWESTARHKLESDGVCVLHTCTGGGAPMKVYVTHVGGGGTDIYSTK
jgi:hypothetical protein